MASKLMEDSFAEKLRIFHESDGDESPLCKPCVNGILCGKDRVVKVTSNEWSRSSS